MSDIRAIERIAGRLLSEAAKASKSAYAPYSNLMVGAAALSDDDEIFTGCNVENASLGLTVCAERVAIFKAISSGATHIKAIAVTCQQIQYCPPCGSCLQVIAEFSKDGFVIIGSNHAHKIKRLSELLPDPYTPEPG